MLECVCVCGGEGGGGAHFMINMVVNPIALGL